MDDVVIARALHVLAVVIWIGGVAMVTMVVLPAVRRGDIGPNRLQVFEAIERRFVWHARLATVIVGLTGFYMTQRLGLVGPVRLGEFWWMHAMVCLWLLFTVVLFVAEPLVLHRWFHARAMRGAGYRLCLAAAGSLAPARAQRHHDPRGRRREPGNVLPLTGRWARAQNRGIAA